MKCSYDPLSKIIERAAQNASYRINELEGWAVGDSPIEKLLWVALRGEIDLGCYDYSNIISPPRGVDFDFEKHGASQAEIALVVESQVDVGNWRVDFLIHNAGFKPRLIVECDGHQFHERTKEQAAKDRSRDREFQAKGYTVFRFTGSEIWRDPCKCADQILDWAMSVEPFS